MKNWEKVTSNSTILSIVKGYSIDFVETRYQPKTPTRAKLKQIQEELVLEEVKEMLENGARREANHCKDQFVSHLFLVSKKDGGQRSAINMTYFNRLIPYKHFKMEGFHLLKEILEQCDYLGKLDLKEAYVCIPLYKQSRKYVCFKWDSSLYEFPFLCFGLGPVPRLFEKLTKLPLSILHKLYI